MDSSDASTLEEKDVSEEEVRTHIEYIKRNPKKSKPSRSQVVICVVHRSNVKLLSDELNRLHKTKWLAAIRSRILAGCFDDLNNIIARTAADGSKTSLVLLITPLASEIKFNVPKCYTTFSIIRCPHSHSDGPYLAIDPTSRYCNIPLPMWDMRQKHLKHTLRLESGVCLINRFGNLGSSTSRYSSDFQAKIRSEAERLQDNHTSWEQRKGIVAFILGALVGGGTTAAKLYTCTKLASGGIFLQCQGVKAGMAGLKFLEIGSATLKAGYGKASLVAAAEIVGTPVLIGATTGVVVGALVYYVPWNSLFDWLRNLWNGFWNWLVEKFQAFCQSVASWWQEDGRRSRSREMSRSSRHSRHGPMRMRGH